MEQKNFLFEILWNITTWDICLRTSFNNNALQNCCYLRVMHCTSNSPAYVFFIVMQHVAKREHTLQNANSIKIFCKFPILTQYLHCCIEWRNFGSLSQPSICKQMFLTGSLLVPPIFSLPHFLVFSFSVRAKWDAWEGEERFVELDFAVLDIINSVVFCAALRSCFTAAIEGLQSQYPRHTTHKHKALLQKEHLWVQNCSNL